MTVKGTNELPVLHPQGRDEEMLYQLHKDTFAYFTDDKLFNNGLIADKTQPGWPASIAVMGLGLSAYISGVENKFISRPDAVRRVLAVLHFLYNSHQGPEPDATGYKGFYYHFLDMQTGKRVWKSELSTIDTAILMAGVISAGQYFDENSGDEAEIPRLADELYRRVDWQWAMSGDDRMTHGWKPESGFLEFRWDSGYSEAHILYTLALGSPTFAIEPEAYKQWLETFEWKRIYDNEFIYAGPLFIHQMSQMWLDFRRIYDDANRKYGLTYFENSRRAVYIQHQYAIQNPLAFEQYGKYAWGLSASDGPGPATYKIKGIERIFYDYAARGVPFGPDDGTISPWAVVASLPFAPEIVLDSVRHMIERLSLIQKEVHGFHASFNATYPDKDGHPYGWVSRWQFGLNQGAVVLMTENFKTGLLWKVFGSSPYVHAGLMKAGFSDKK